MRPWVVASWVAAILGSTAPCFAQDGTGDASGAPSEPGDNRSSARRAPTDAEVAQARTFFSAGAAAYATARYTDAARAFARAQELAPRPSILFSLAQAERKAFFATSDTSYLRRAIAHYKAYLAEVPEGGRRAEATEAKADLEARLARAGEEGRVAESAEKRGAHLTVYSAVKGARASLDGAPPQSVPFFTDLAPGRHLVKVFADGYVPEEREVSGDYPVDVPLDVALREKPAALTIDLAETADVYLDGRMVASTPLAGPLPVAPGAHVLSVVSNGRRAFTREIVLTRGKALRVDPALETSTQRVVALGMLGVGAASLLTSGVTALLALNAEGRAKDIDEVRASGNISADDLAEHNRAIERRDDLRAASIVTFAAGATLFAGGAFLALFDRPGVAAVPARREPGSAPHRPEGFELSAAPIVAPGHVGGTLSVRF